MAAIFRRVQMMTSAETMTQGIQPCHPGTTAAPAAGDAGEHAPRRNGVECQPYGKPPDSHGDDEPHHEAGERRLPGRTAQDPQHHEYGRYRQRRHHD